jgi:hypothetical protein
VLAVLVVTVGGRPEIEGAIAGPDWKIQIKFRVERESVK